MSPSINLCLMQEHLNVFDIDKVTGFIRRSLMDDAQRLREEIEYLQVVSGAGFAAEGRRLSEGWRGKKLFFSSKFVVSRRRLLACCDNSCVVADFKALGRTYAVFSA